jgi:hypothetical protein
VKASVKDIVVDSINGFNIHWEAPFKLFNDYTCGFNYALGSLKTLPQSIFVKRSVESEKGDGSTSVELEYHVEKKLLDVDAKWVAENSDLEVTAYGNSDDRFVDLGISDTVKVDGRKVKYDVKYNFPKKKLSGAAKVNFDDSTVIELSGNNIDKDPKLKVSHKLNSKDTIEPSISLKTREVAYGWKRKWTGGSVEAVYHPSDTVDVTWKDEGANGVWTTKAQIPVEDKSNTKITFSRDWKY